MKNARDNTTAPEQQQPESNPATIAEGKSLLQADVAKALALCQELHNARPSEELRRVEVKLQICVELLASA